MQMNIGEGKVAAAGSRFDSTMASKAALAIYYIV